MKVVKGYRAIEIPVSSSLSSHSFFIKEHADSKSSSKSKTLFVGNVDYCGQRSNEDIDCYLRELFGTFGEIESISVSEFKSVERYDHQSRFAHITFKKSSHLKSVLSAADEAYLQCGIEVSRLWGLQDIFKKRSRQELYEALRSDEVDPVDLKSEVYEQMKDFEENEEIAKAERERKLNEVDDDGFRPVKHRFVFIFLLDCTVDSFCLISSERRRTGWRKREVEGSTESVQQRRTKS